MIRIQKYTDEERQFFVKQIRALYPEMYRFVKAQLHPLNRGMAEDLVQTAISKAWESFHLLRDRKAFRSWIFRILKDTRNEYYRRVIRERDILVFYEDPEEEAWDRIRKNKIDEYLNEDLLLQKDILETLIDDEKSQLLIEAFDRLNEKEQELLRLHLIGECTEKELAEMYGINYNTLRSRIHRGLRKLRAIYEELVRGDEDE